MNGNRNNRTHFLDVLPVHRPDEGLWTRIEIDLNATGTNPVSANLSNKLPTHSPRPETWNNIEKQISSKSNTSQKLVRTGLAGIFLLFVTIFFILVFQNKGESPSDVINNTQQLIISEKQGNRAQTSQQTVEKPHGFLEEKSSKLNDNGSFIEKPDDEKIRRIEKSNEKLNNAAFIINEDSNTNQDFESVKNPENKENKKDYFVGISNIPAKQNISEIQIPFENNLNTDLKTGKSKIAFQKPFITEIGLFIQPFYTKNVSSISKNWIMGKAAGITIAVRNPQFLLETGLIFSQIKFEDDFEIKYYSYQYLGPVVCIESFHEIMEINEEGDTIVTRQYYPEVIELYDSTFNETEKPDKVTISKVGIPFFFGSRLIEKGKFFTDVKAGLEMSVISKKTLQVNTVFNEKTTIVAVENGQPDTYAVKWKYNLSLKIGYRLGEKTSIFAEPFYSKYIDQMQKQVGVAYPKPEEAGIRIGFSIEY